MKSTVNSSDSKMSHCKKTNWNRDVNERHFKYVRHDILYIINQGQKIKIDPLFPKFTNSQNLCVHFRCLLSPWVSGLDTLIIRESLRIYHFCFYLRDRYDQLFVPRWVGPFGCARSTRFLAKRNYNVRHYQWTSLNWKTIILISHFTLNIKSLYRNPNQHSTSLSLPSPPYSVKALLVPELHLQPPWS